MEGVERSILTLSVDVLLISVHVVSAFVNFTILARTASRESVGQWQPLLVTVVLEATRGFGNPTACHSQGANHATS